MSNYFIFCLNLKYFIIIIDIELYFVFRKGFIKMEFTKDIYFEDELKVGKETQIVYSGFLFQNGANSVNIVYGFGKEWNHTTTKQMEKQENGFAVNIQIEDYDIFNFCFSDNNNNWDNNNNLNYISNIIPNSEEDAFDYSSYKKNLQEIEDLFYEATKISSKLNFSYKNDYILVTLLKASLEKNYIYYLEEFLEKIVDLTYK